MKILPYEEQSLSCRSVLHVVTFRVRTVHSLSVNSFLFDQEEISHETSLFHVILKKLALLVLDFVLTLLVRNFECPLSPRTLFFRVMTLSDRICQYAY